MIPMVLEETGVHDTEWKEEGRDRENGLMISNRTGRRTGCDVGSKGGCGRHTLVPKRRFDDGNFDGGPLHVVHVYEVALN